MKVFHKLLKLRKNEGGQYAHNMSSVFQQAAKVGELSIASKEGRRQFEPSLHENI